MRTFAQKEKQSQKRVSSTSARIHPLMQTKLAISQPGDRYEQEADRAAEQVMRMHEPRVQRACACGGGCPNCQTENQAHDHEHLRASHVGSGGPKPIDAPPIVDGVLSAPGQPLDMVARAIMEPRFAADFSRVRVHTDDLAAQSAEAVGAEAYTVGPDVVFGHGRYAPSSREGQRLLAHELTHVLQQTEGTARLVIARQPAPPQTAPPKSKTVFHPGVNHDHKPSGRWTDVQNAPNSDFWENRVCKNFDPIDVMRAASFAKFQGKWIAIDHLKWFLNGGGADFVEDSNLDLMLRTDSGIQAILSAKIPTGRSSGAFAGHFKITQSDYDDEDFQFGFGAIDRLDFKVDFAAGTLHAWFQDRYEWHPVYSFYNKFPDDVARGTNCVHAAGVELKSGTARDYWMKGEARIPLTALKSAAAKPGLQAPAQIY